MALGRKGQEEAGESWNREMPKAGAGIAGHVGHEVTRGLDQSDRVQGGAVVL